MLWFEMIVIPSLRRKTGTTPFDKERLGNASYDEIRRIIREEEAPKPSTRISTLGQAATTVSTNRQSDPRRLSRLFHGELDWIVMQCLEKDRSRRYETVSALAADVERYLHDEPVLACPPSTVYRLRKLARRYKGALISASAVALAALLAVAALAVGTGLVWRANAELTESLDRERREAYFQRITVADRELSIDNLAASDAIRNLGGAYTVAYTVAFSPPDGRLVAAGNDGDVNVWDWNKRGQPLHTFSGYEAHSIPVAFSPDGRRLAVGGGGQQSQLWDVETGDLFCPLPARSFPVNALAFSPDGGRLASAGLDRMVYVHDTTTGERLSKFIHSGNVLCVAFSRKGRLVASAGKTRRCAFGTRRPAGKCSACGGIPKCAHAWPSAPIPTAGALRRPAPTGPYASGTRPRSGRTTARNS
jgi:hypothetical protein